MSHIQIKIMKAVFSVYNTPTMAECEMLGSEIGLPKRVVQVWFQNARAKDKKGKLNLNKALGNDSSLPEDCKFCNFKYTHKYSLQDHIFSKSHIANIKVYLENSSKENEPNEFIAPPPLPSGSGSLPADSTTNPQQQHQQVMNNNTHLQYLQMTGSQVPNSAVKVEQEDNTQETLFQQIYAMNNSNFAVQNQYMHHAMFGANGKSQF